MVPGVHIMRLVRFALSAFLTLVGLGAATSIPAQASPPDTFAVAPEAHWAWSGDHVALTARDVPAKSRVRFITSGPGCFIHGAKGISRVTSYKPTTCRVRAIAFGNQRSEVAKSEAVFIEFRQRPPAAFNGKTCTIVGTPKGEVLQGTNGDDVICGMGGNDRIQARGGDDVIDGGAGTDTLNGGRGLNLCDYEATELRVETCRYDDAAPTIEVSTGTPVISPGTSGAEVVLALNISDEIGIRGGSVECRTSQPVINWGFRYGVPGFDAPDDGTSTLQQASGGQVLPASNFQETVSRDSVRFDLRIPVATNAAPGPATCSIVATDRLGHTQRSTFQDLFTIRQETPSDSLAPQPIGIVFANDTIDLSNGPIRAQATVSLQDHPDLRKVDVYCSPDIDSKGISGDPIWLSYWENSGLPFAANSDSGFAPGNGRLTVQRDGSTLELRYSWSLRQTKSAGLYDCAITTEDIWGNTSRVMFPKVVTILDVPGRDLNGPRLRELTVSPVVVDVGRSSAEVRLRLALNDPSGVASAYVSCIADMAAEQSIQSPRVLSASFQAIDFRADEGAWYVSVGEPGINWREERITGVDAAAPVLETTLTIPFGYSPGLYACHAHMQDTLGNGSSERVDASLSILRTE